MAVTVKIILIERDAV